MKIHIELTGAEKLVLAGFKTGRSDLIMTIAFLALVIWIYQEASSMTGIWYYLTMACSIFIMLMVASGASTFTQNALYYWRPAWQMRKIRQKEHLEGRPSLLGPDDDTFEKSLRIRNESLVKT